MLRATYSPPEGKPEPVTIIQIDQSDGHAAVAVFLTSAGILSEAKLNQFSNVHEELVPNIRQGSSLTRCQQDVLRYLTKGYSNSLIAEALGVGEQTVKTHISNILAKLGASNRTQAVAMAIENNLL